MTVLSPQMASGRLKLNAAGEVAQISPKSLDNKYWFLRKWKLGHLQSARQGVSSSSGRLTPDPQPYDPPTVPCQRAFLGSRIPNLTKRPRHARLLPANFGDLQISNKYKKERRHREAEMEAKEAARTAETMLDQFLTDVRAVIYIPQTSPKPHPATLAGQLKPDFRTRQPDDIGGHQTQNGPMISHESDTALTEVNLGENLIVGIMIGPWAYLLSVATPEGKRADSGSAMNVLPQAATLDKRR
ncbi:hypothetical protein EV702DRAFT_1269820 [Suillus placidus]|uniref:Uncharacterized protein n=1 Tax=Suillus placidus TaxID=48579 RepID=A0A9P7D0L7_9AGAM|nr:hypothetical protein EV702DRAFT_1269820 [Suillus placidus]